MKSHLSPKAAEIVRCARSLLAVGGYASFSYADIAGAVQITKASIHHHFPTKAQLVRTVVKTYREEALAGMAAVDAHIPEPLAQLQAYLAFWESCLHDRTASFCVCAMLAAELPTLPALVAEEVRGHFHDSTSWLCGVMDKGANTGAFKLQTHAKWEAMAFMAVVHGALLAARAYGDSQVFAAVMVPTVRHLTVL